MHHRNTRQEVIQMATRRQKLKYVLENAVANGVTTADLLGSVESFTAQGGSGIENFLDATLANGFKPAGASTQAVKDALHYIQKAEDVLNAAI